MFIDTAKISVKAGNGGNGCVSFHREKYVAAGGPDGGDGGKGGDILFVADQSLSTLADFRYKRHYAAQDGENGQSRKRAGKNALDLVIRVPVGTILKEAESGRILADITSTVPVRILKGGKGGWGNCHFATPTRQIPRFAKSGVPGQEGEILLELKLLADVGLIGMPNVGKSTLLSVLSDAKPTIADYHFTTLTPVLGVVRVEEGTSFVMADIPGLIEGASEGTGLGHTFLRHIERCRLLLHVIDVSESEGRYAVNDYELIQKEMRAFNPKLAEKPQIVVANKCDMADEEQIMRLKQRVGEDHYPFSIVSAPIHYGTEELVYAIVRKLQELPGILEYKTEPEPLHECFDSRDDFSVTVKVQEDIYSVEGKWLLRLIQNTNFDDYESLQHFQRILRDRGVIEKLEQAGISEGDTVVIYDIQFDYIP